MANHVEAIQQQDLKKYTQYLHRLKKFETTVLKVRDSLGYFDSALRHYKTMYWAHQGGLWTNPLENVDKKLFQYTLGLLRNLLILKNNALEKKTDPILYPAACNIWQKFAQLTQEILQNSRNEWGFGDRERKIEALTDGIEKAAAVIKEPTNADASLDLIKSAAVIRSEIEGRFFSRKENRFWAGLVGALGFLVGFALYVTAIMAVPASIIGGIIGIGIGIAIMAYCGRMVYRALWPDDCDVDSIRNEKNHGRQTAALLGDFAILAKNTSALFAARDRAKSAEKGKEKPKMKKSKSFNGMW